jgi:hypothetical protein
MTNGLLKDCLVFLKKMLLVFLDIERTDKSRLLHFEAL